jgi:hypothetical protein
MTCFHEGAAYGDQEALKQSPDYRVENLLEAAKLVENLLFKTMHGLRCSSRQPTFAA